MGHGRGQSTLSPSLSMDPQARAVSLPGTLSAHGETEAQRGRQLAQPVAQPGSLLPPMRWGLEQPTLGACAAPADTMPRGAHGIRFCPTHTLQRAGPAGGRKALDTLLHCSRAPCSPGGWGRKPLALSASMLVSAWSPQDRRRPWASCPLSSAHSSPRGPGSGAQLRAQPRTGSASPGTLPRSFPLDEPPGSQGCLVPV